MGVNGCQKGKNGERELGKVLSKWWDDAEFVRSPGSGGFMTIHAAELMKGGYDMGGDFICPPDFPFSVECKRRKVIDLYSMVRISVPNPDDKESPISWWHQCSRDAQRSNKHPLVCFREDRKQWYILIETNVLYKLYPENQYVSMYNFSICPLKYLTSILKENILNVINSNEVNL